MPETTPVKPRILVVASERVISESLAMILNQAGYEARSAYSGEEAIEKASEFKPDALFSDIIMDGMNGIDAAILTRQILPSIRIRFFSGQAATADWVEKAHALGHDVEIWAAPVHPQDLLRWLRNLK